jgi:hypothetical protein
MDAVVQVKRALRRATVAPPALPPGAVPVGRPKGQRRLRGRSVVGSPGDAGTDLERS